MRKLTKTKKNNNQGSSGPEHDDMDMIVHFISKVIPALTLRRELSP